MVAPGSSDVVRGVPYVDEMIVWDPVTIHADSRGTHRTVRAKLAFIKDLRAKHFDKIYVLKRSLSSALIARLSGARERIGFDTEGRGFLLTKRVPYSHECHEVQNFLEVLRSDGLAVTDDFLELWTTREEEHAAQALLRNEGVEPSETLVAIHPFSAVVERGWPLENFAEVAASLRKSGCRVLLLGGPGDRAPFDSVRHLFSGNAVDLIGKSTLSETAALLKKTSLFIGNDSGLMHVAAAAGVPLVAIFGPQSPVKFGPWSKKARVLYKGLACSPCRQKFFTECRPSERMRPACVEAVTVAEVLDPARELLDESRGDKSIR
jgi:heptosyltransferase-2